MKTLSKYDSVKEHFSKNKDSVKLSREELRDNLRSTLGEFSKQLFEMRSGKAKDSNGNTVSAFNLSFEDGCKMFYGATKDEFLHSLGIHTNDQTMYEVAQNFGCDHLSPDGFKDMMVNYSTGTYANASTGSTANTTNIPNDFRFIIPELIFSAIFTAYEHSSLSQNWIAGTENMSQRKGVMPRIMRGDTMPTYVAEGGDIPFGSIQFGQKSVDQQKIGIGFSMTDELIMESSLDMVFIFLRSVGNNMAIGADNLALAVLVDGEQTDLSESAAVIGVETPATFSYKDIKRAFTRGVRLNMPYSRIIAGEEDNIDITGIDRFEGFDGVRQLASIRSIAGVPDTFTIDTHVPPEDQIIFINPETAMVRLRFRGMTSERRRNIQNQTEELFVSDYIGYAIVKRDGRLIMDKSLDFSVNGFPAFMDVDSRISETFVKF